MTPAGAPARRAWAALAGLEALTDLQVMVDPASPLGPAGWIAILGLDGTVTAAVPEADLRAPVMAALGGLSSEEATRPELVGPRLPPTLEVLGPAPLFYPPPGFAADIAVADGAARVGRDRLDELLARVSPDDLEESGLAEVPEPVFGSFGAGGRLAAAGGYRQWPNGVAHISILTAPDRRREGHGHRAAAAAIHHAIAAGLLPQWRARPVASQALARRVGFVELGAQVCFRVRRGVRRSRRR